MKDAYHGVDEEELADAYDEPGCLLFALFLGMLAWVILIGLILLVTR